MLDDELVVLLKQGDEGAFSDLYSRHSSGILRHLFHLVGNKEEAEELLHESMMLMLKKIDFYQPRLELKNSFKAWLYRLSTNRAIDEIRKRKGRMDQVNESQEIKNLTNEEAYSQHEQQTLVGGLLMKLPSFQRTVLGLRVQEDLSYTEISAVLGRDINTVKQGLFQARKKMKELLTENGEFL